MMAQRRWLLGLVLLATLMAAWLAPADDPVVRSVDTKASKGDPIPSGVRMRLAPTTQSHGLLQLELATREVPQERASVDLFAAKSWYRAPVMAAAASRVAEPVSSPAVTVQAPALPYRFMGRVVEDGQAMYLLTRGERLFVVRLGEDFDKNYRLERAESTRLLIRYVPLAEEQTLAISPMPNE